VPRSGDATRDLLFGTLTLQVGMIDQGQLAAALHDWARARDRPLADHLAARGDLDAEQRAGVEAMVALHLKKRERRTEPIYSARRCGELGLPSSRPHWLSKTRYWLR
jgi:hypothetical protein